MIPPQQLEDKIRTGMDRLHLTEETFSTILGTLVVIIISVFALNYFRESRRSSQITMEAMQTVNEELLAQESSPSAKTLLYTVTETDTLWSIAEKAYGDGELWDELAQANHLASPDYLDAGIKLQLPALNGVPAVLGDQTVKEATNSGEVLSATSIEALKPGEYVVKAGDSLQLIAERAYGHQDQWTKIAEANNLWNPDQLEVGMKLTIPEK